MRWRCENCGHFFTNFLITMQPQNFIGGLLGERTNYKCPRCGSSNLSNYTLLPDEPEKYKEIEDEWVRRGKPSK